MELTHIKITKLNDFKVQLKVDSFRNDALPNTNLKTPEIIRGTAFTLFVNTVLENTQHCKLLASELQTIVGEKVRDLFLGPKTVDHFLRDVKITHIQAEESFETTKLMLTEEQLKLLYTYMQYGADEVDISDSFYVDILSKGDRGMAVRKILGEDNYSIVEPCVVMELEFSQKEYLDGFIDLEADSPLDTYISDWMKRE